MKGKLDDGTPVDVEKPGVVLWYGQWYEPIEYRACKEKEPILETDNQTINIEHVAMSCPWWIMAQIPRATAEQLKAIGMHEGNGGRPVICNEEDIIWMCETHYGYAGISHIGKYRFVLEPDVREEVPESTPCEICENRYEDGHVKKCKAYPIVGVKENPCPKYILKKEIHTSCAGCEYSIVDHFRSWFTKECETCFPEMDYNHERKNYTAKQPPADEYRLLKPDEIIQKGDEYEAFGGWATASSIGYTVKSQVNLIYRRKIQPPQPEEPRFSVGVPNCDLCGSIQTKLGAILFGPAHDDVCIKRHVCINCYDKIAAFTERSKRV